ncbi:MAG: cobyrinate a,c-diamide synthase [Thermodesulfovibrionales bacterium]|nr:cobyrinate a,c-diamide synthase [Thermodesulfovibrionales bacterium]
MKGFLIAGTHSGCGKTTVSLALMASLNNSGYKVQPFKVGPDFIDTGLHKIATGIKSRNLDLFMCSSNYVKHLFITYSKDISVIEGVMGLYDGKYSTYNLAKTLNVPIILIVDATGIAESVSAIIKGFLYYDKERLIKAVIFNKVGSERHIQRLNNGTVEIPILGYLKKDLFIEIPNRHLGLQVYEENPLSQEALNTLIDETNRCIDINQLIIISEINDETVKSYKKIEINEGLFYGLPNQCKIAIAYDKAFCFYYEDNIDFFKEKGNEIIMFSPLQDNTLPDVDFIYIGGGYPELYAKELSENKAMIDAIRRWSHLGRPLYAECGGLMYLSKGLFDFDDNFFEMVGLFPLKTKMRHKLARLGYRNVYIEHDCILSKKGGHLRGHEYHYSEIVYKGHLQNIYTVTDAEGNRVDTEGYLYNNTLASYIHIYFGSFEYKKGIEGARDQGFEGKKFNQIF